MIEASLRDKRPGTVCTFYSYKGGVGRSMAVANVGVVMAMEGHRVLLVDWDLEAPGLEVYFRNGARLTGDPQTKPGMIDLLEAQAGSESLAWTECLLKAKFFGRSLDIISAGSRTDDYRRRVQQLNWDELFGKHRIGNYVNHLREEWRAAYDVVLIDSRTGITDIGDICTVLLPDILVLMFVANLQNVEGIKDAMARAVTARSKLPVNRSKLLGVPISARDERDREYDKSVEWQHTFAAAFGDLYREWLPKEVNPADALNKLYIPYVAAWSFGEHIPVIESDRERSDPSSIGAAYTRLATLLVHRLDWYAIESQASVDELVGTRVELSKVREEKRAAETLVADTKRRARIWIAGLVVTFLFAAVGGIVWYQNLPEPVSTDLFVGDRLQREGDLAGSLRVYEARKQSLEESAGRAPLDRGVQRELSVVLNRIGAAQQTLGKLTEALASFESSKAIIEKLVAKSPENSEWQRDLAVTHNHIGGVLLAQGRLPEALASHRADKAINDKLVAGSPENTQYQSDSSVSHNQIGRVLFAQGKLVEALASFESSKAIMDKLAAKSPENTEWQRDLAVTYNHIGRVLRAQGKLAEALRSFESGKAIMNKLAGESPEYTGWQRDLAISNSLIGRVLQAQGKLAEALASHQTDKAIAEKLVAKRPEDTEWQRDLAATLTFIGHLQLEMQQPMEALQSLDRAAEISSRSDVAGLALAKRDMIRVQRYRVDAFLALDNLKAARDGCEKGKVATGRVAVNDSNRLFWEPDLTALDMACAEVIARDGDLAGAVMGMAEAAVRLRELAAVSSGNDEILRESARADKRATELRSALAPTAK